MSKKTFSEKFGKTKDKDKEKSKSISKKSEKVDFDPELMVVEDLEYLLDGDMDITEDVLEILQETYELLEAKPLSVSARIKKRQVLRRSRARIKLGRRRAMRRRANQTRIKKRARRQAVNNMKRRFSGGRKMSELSYSERARVERMASRRKAAINRQSVRLIRTKREQERKRLSR